MVLGTFSFEKQEQSTNISKHLSNTRVSFKVQGKFTPPPPDAFSKSRHWTCNLLIIVTATSSMTRCKGKLQLASQFLIFITGLETITKTSVGNKARLLTLNAPHMRTNCKLEHSKTMLATTTPTKKAFNRC